MARGAPHLVIEGYETFQKLLRLQTGKLPKALGEAHKEVGRFIIQKVPPGDPHAIGAGMGATIRASARKRDVNLMVGYGARPTDRGDRGGVLAQWGKVPVGPFKSGRPHIIGVVLEHQDEISDKFLDEIIGLFEPVFHSATKS